MRKICAALTALSFATLLADEGFVENHDMHVQETTPQVVLPRPAQIKKVDAFKAFTGKVKGKKVRLRASPDMESTIIRELSQGELISIVEDKGDFWGVQPTQESKAYIFRSFVLDNTVEGSRVNVRLKPSTDAPIIAHLSTGDKIEGSVCTSNSKWMEIKAPESARFYVAKEYVENVGGPDMKAQYEKRLTHGRQMLDATLNFARSEMKKSYDRIEHEKIVSTLKSLAEEFNDITEISHHANSELHQLQEALLQKRINYLEDKARGIEPHDEVAKQHDSMTDKMKMWEPIEEALYLSWSCVNEDKNIEQFYEEQRMDAVAVTGYVEAYDSQARSKPGDYLLKDGSAIKGCLYSTKVDLQKYVGKKVTVYGIERPNNNYAFPAYYVVEAE